MNKVEFKPIGTELFFYLNGKVVSSTSFRVDIEVNKEDGVIIKYWFDVKNQYHTVKSHLCFNSKEELIDSL
ncbi:MAG TPA: hypothetical protein PK075_11930 [Chitinophagales bacterium]|nr:hypothetical protein [Chitinophagales bacterium]